MGSNTAEMSISVDAELEQNLREYVFANIRLKSYQAGSHAFDKARLDLLLRADTLAESVARRVGALKGIKE